VTLPQCYAAPIFGITKCYLPSGSGNFSAYILMTARSYVKESTGNCGFFWYLLLQTWCQVLSINFLVRCQRSSWKRPQHPVHRTFVHNVCLWFCGDSSKGFYAKNLGYVWYLTLCSICTEWLKPSIVTSFLIVTVVSNVQIPYYATLLQSTLNTLCQTTIKPQIGAPWRLLVQMSWTNGFYSRPTSY